MTTGEFLDAYCNCVGGSNLISGQVFLDLDQDGVFDGSDVPLPNRMVKAGPNNRFTSTDEFGNFYIVVPSGSYVLTAFPGSFDVMAQAPPVINFPGEGLISSGHAIAMNATSLEPDLSAHACMSMAIPGFLNIIYSISRNRGTTPTSGSMGLTHDTQLDFITTQAPAAVVNNTISWDVPDLQPGEVYWRRTILQTPSNLPIGSTVTDVIDVLADPADNVPDNDQFIANRTVTGSWDPNDKQVMPSVLTPEEVASGRPLEYTIRFQNTGTFAAQNVRITDQLPAGVDPATFEFIASSHACHTNFQNGVLEFRFDNIDLPDSGANEVESHGFLLFRVKPQTTLLPGDAVWNRAYIYFDFNEPVITNAATFSVELNTAATPAAKEMPAIAPWPNPVTDVLNVSVERTSHYSSVTIIDLNGRVVHSFATAATHEGVITIPVADLADGLYTVRVGSGLKAIHQRFVKSH